MRVSDIATVAILKSKQLRTSPFLFVEGCKGGWSPEPVLSLLCPLSFALPQLVSLSLSLPVQLEYPSIPPAPQIFSAQLLESVN